MANLLERITQVNYGCMDQRPSRDDFQGINLDSFQAQGLMAWWPLWEPMANGQAAPQAMDHAPFQLHMVPSTNTWHVPDPQMGCAWFGDLFGWTGAAFGALGSGRSHLRRYAASIPEGPVDPVDFGNNPSIANSATTGAMYMSTAWCKTNISGLTLTTQDTPPDMYIYSFDRADATDFPGHTLGAICQTPNGGAATAPICATIFDNSVANDPYGVQSLQIINDDRWHLICGIYMPLSNNNNNNAQQWLLVDGNIGFVGGVDTGGAGTQPFGHSTAQTLLGSPQDATHVSTNPGGVTYQVIGADDNGVDSPWQGYICDHRFYAFPAPPGIFTATQDWTNLFMAMAAHMYSPETRWELYKPRPKVGYSLSSGVQLPNTANVAWFRA